MPTRRYEPDVAEFSELQRAYLWRALLYGAPALVTILFTFVILMVGLLTPAAWWVLFLLALPAFFGACFQLVLIFIERPALSVDAVAVEVGEGVLRFVNDDAGTVEEVRWKDNAALSIARKNDCVEITFPSGRRSRVHWFAYSEREQLLKDLMALKETKPDEAKPETKLAEAAQTKTEDAGAKNAKSAKTSTKARKKTDEEE